MPAPARSTPTGGSGIEQWLPGRSSDDSALLGDVVTALRDFAQRIDISPAYWSRIEREMEKAPKNELMEKAATVLGLEVDEVFIGQSSAPRHARDVRGVVHAYRKRPKSED